MKRFLKRVNRGIILGAFALIVLIIYLIVDYSNFSKEKSQIKTTLENYISGYYELMEKNDYDGLANHVNDTWTSKKVMNASTFWYDSMENILFVFEDVDNYPKMDDYGQIEHSIKKITVKKSGPNMAYATIKYSAEVEFGAYGEPIHPFGTYISYWYDPEQIDENRYVFNIDYEAEVYLIKEDGQWRLSQSQGWETSYNQGLKEEE